jgi:hypothetical protein
VVFRHIASVAGELAGGFFKGETDAGLVEFHCSTDEEFHAGQRLPAVGAAADESGPSSRKTAEGDLIESVDSSWAFWKNGWKGFRSCSLRFQRPHFGFA